MKKIFGVYSSSSPHWVGDGFPARTMFSYETAGQHISPFLLLDYAGPAEFTPRLQHRGVGAHPHRGFETVTIVYQGAVEHKDSAGNGGIIEPGDVQWMTAGSGVLHEEFHSPAFSQTGGTLEMVQLWVNLPAQHKMTAPAYQTLQSRDIPIVKLPGDAGIVRIIAGTYEGCIGPAHTFTSMNVWDVRLHVEHETLFTLPPNQTAIVAVLHGNLSVNGGETVESGQTVLLDQPGKALSIKAHAESIILLLSGDPIDEPVVAFGPFVMNTEQEILQARKDYGSGAFGRILP